MVVSSEYILFGHCPEVLPLLNIVSNSVYTSALLISSNNIRLANEWLRRKPDFKIDSSKSCICLSLKDSLAFINKFNPPIMPCNGVLNS